jgi:hypothetical protein
MADLAKSLAEMNARLEAFNKSIASMSDEALLQTFRSIKDAQKGAKTGNGDGESEDLLLKGLAAEAEIARRPLAALRARVEAFGKSLPAKTDEELFQSFYSIEDAKKGAKTGNGDGESEDLLLKGLAAEAEIIRRHPDKMMRAYSEWLAARK